MRLSELKPGSFQIEEQAQQPVAGAGAPMRLSQLPEGSWKAEETSPEASISMLESGLRGLAQGASFGFADEITGAIEGALTDKTYEQARDESRANYDKASNANPLTYGAGEIAGGVGTALVPGLNVAKGASLATKIGVGAGAGAAYGLGASEADLTKGEIGGAAADTATGAVVGGAVSGAVESLSPLAKYVSKKAAEKSLDFAIDAIHPRMQDLKRYYGTEKLRQMGQELIDQKIIKPFDTADDIYRKLVERTQDIGESIEAKVNIGMPQEALLDTGEFVDRMKNETAAIAGTGPNAAGAVSKVGTYLDDTVSKLGTPIENPNSLVPEQGFGGSVVSTGGEELAPPIGGSYGLEGGGTLSKEIIDPVYGTTQIVQEPGPGTLKYRQGQSAIHDPVYNPAPTPQLTAGSSEIVGKVAPFDHRPRTLDPVDIFNLDRNIGNDIYNPHLADAKKPFEHIRRTLSETIKAADPSGEVAAMKKQYHLLEEGERIARNEAARMQANQSYNLGDFVAATAGASAFGPGGLALGVAKHLMRTRGSSTAAVGLDKLSKILAAAPDMFGSYGPILKKAAARGTNALAVQHYVLSQRDPKYREQLEKLNAQQPK